MLSEKSPNGFEKMLFVQLNSQVIDYYLSRKEFTKKRKKRFFQKAVLEKRDFKLEVPVAQRTSENFQFSPSGLRGLRVFHSRGSLK